MPTPMPSPTGTNFAKKFLPANWPNPTMAYDSKHGLDNHNVQRAAKFLRAKLGADSMREFQRLLAKDDNGENESGEKNLAAQLQDIYDALHLLPGSDDLDKVKSMVQSLLGSGGESDAEDDTDIDNPPSKREDASDIDQPPPFQGRPLRNSNASAMDSRSRLFAEDTSQGDALKRMRANMARIQVLG